MWQRGDHPPLPSCAIITVPPNALVAGAARPDAALLAAEDWEPWLDPAAPREALRTMLRPAEVRLAIHPVTPRMNHHAYEEPDAVVPLAAAAGAEQLSLEW